MDKITLLEQELRDKGDVLSLCELGFEINLSYLELYKKICRQSNVEYFYKEIFFPLVENFKSRRKNVCLELARILTEDFKYGQSFKKEDWINMINTEKIEIPEDYLKREGEEVNLNEYVFCFRDKFNKISDFELALKLVE